MLSLTEKQAAFVREYADNGFNQSQAYLKAYGTDKKTVASTEASKLMKDDKILTAIEIEIGSNKRLSWELGLDRREVMKALKKIIKGKKTIVDKDGDVFDVDYDEKSVIAAINTLAKLTGDFREDGSTNVNFNIGNNGLDLSKVKNPEELKKIAAQLHSEMNKQ